MADEDTEVTIEALHAAIVAGIAGAFSQFVTVEFYRDDEDHEIPTPACILEMTEAEPDPGNDAGTGQWCVLARFEARIILASATPNARMQIRKAATSVARWLHLRHFAGVLADASQVIACEPDEFAPNLDRFQVWRVEWVTPCMLGESTWLPDETTPPTPERALYSFVPKIGTAHEADYRDTDGNAP